MTLESVHVADKYVFLWEQTVTLLSTIVCCGSEFDLFRGRVLYYESCICPRINA